MAEMANLEDISAAIAKLTEEKRKAGEPRDTDLEMALVDQAERQLYPSKQNIRSLIPLHYMNIGKNFLIIGEADVAQFDDQMDRLYDAMCSRLRDMVDHDYMGWAGASKKARIAEWADDDYCVTVLIDRYDGHTDERLTEPNINLQILDNDGNCNIYILSSNSWDLVGH